MGCPSPASVLVELAMQTASQEVLSDTEDDLSRAVGAPRSWLEEALESSSDASSDFEEASCSHGQPVSSSECLSSALHVHLQQQQQVELQHILGRLTCKVQQIDLIEEWRLEEIAGDYAQRQEDLVTEDRYYHEELERQRDIKLKALYQEHSSKAQQNQQAQESIKSQERELQKQREDLQQKELEAKRKQQQDLERQQQEQQQQQLQEQQHQQQTQQLQQQAQQSAKGPGQEGLTAQPQQQPQQQHSSQQQQPLQQAAGAQDVATAPEQAAQLASGSQTVHQQPNATDPASLLRVAESAAAEETRYREALQRAEDSVSNYISDDSRKKERRDIDKQLLKLIQQVSGTQEQVGLKSDGILKLFSQLQGPQIAYAYLQLARKLLQQCENQIALNQRSCFPFAEVTAAVAAHHPDFAVLLIAKMQQVVGPGPEQQQPAWVAICFSHNAGRNQVCPLAVPKCYLAAKGAQKHYHKQMRFQEGQDPKSGQVTFEKAELYMRRNSGFIAFYAALMQSLRPGNPVGLDSAWKYLARLLNSLPANRATGTALVAFLQTAGYRLFMVYKGQFIKVLKYIFDNFYPKLTQSNDSDAKAIAARLGQYINQHLYRQLPDGQDLPTHDQSTDVGLYP